jgi:glycerate kinase
VTGEGRADGQTLHGKLPAAVARSSEAAGVPVALVAGGVDEQARPALSQRFVALESLTDAAGSAQSAMDEAPRWLEQAGAALAERFLR